MSMKSSRRNSIYYDYYFHGYDLQCVTYDIYIRVEITQSLSGDVNVDNTAKTNYALGLSD